MNKTAKSTADKDGPMGSNSTLYREDYTVSDESLISPLIAKNVYQALEKGDNRGL